MSQKQILAVDDEPGIARLIKVNLERAGYAVELAADGQEAWEKIEAEPDRFDLIISDVMMPRKDGIGLLSDIRSHPATANLPVILLTAKSQNADITEGYSVGTDMYLTKPFSPPELLVWVERVLKGVTQETGELPGVFKI